MKSLLKWLARRIAVQLRLPFHTTVFLKVQSGVHGGCGGGAWFAPQPIGVMLRVDTLHDANLYVGLGLFTIEIGYYPRFV